MKYIADSKALWPMMRTLQVRLAYVYANFQSPPQPYLGIEAKLILRIVDTTL